MKGKNISKDSSIKQLDYLSAFHNLENKVEHMFQRMWHSPFAHDNPTDVISYGSLTNMPKMDVIDKDKEILVKAELPGIEKKDIVVEIANNQLIIKAKTCHEKKEEEGDYLKREISKNEIYRSVLLPAGIDDDSKVKTSFKNGVLELSIAKPKKSQRRQIEVK